MKKLFPIFLVAVLATTVLSACGVPQEDYDKLASDLAAAQTQIQNLETQLASVNDKNNALQEELDATVAEYENLMTEYENLNTEYGNLDAKSTATVDEFFATIEGAYPYFEILVELSGPAITGDGLSEALTKSNVETWVIKAEDEGLQAKYDDWAKIFAPAIKADMMASFKSDVWLKYFNSYSPTPLTVEIKSDPYYHSNSYTGFIAEFSDAEKNTVFKFHFTTYLLNVYKKENTLGSGDLSYPLSVWMEGYHAGRKQKFKQTEYTATSDHRVLKDPTVLVPTVKIKKMFATGSTLLPLCAD